LLVVVAAPCDTCSLDSKSFSSDLAFSNFPLLLCEDEHELFEDDDGWTRALMALVRSKTFFAKRFVEELMEPLLLQSLPPPPPPLLLVLFLLLLRFTW
jgi:hypothetical protein